MLDQFPGSFQRSPQEKERIKIGAHRKAAARNAHGHHSLCVAASAN